MAFAILATLATLAIPGGQAEAAEPQAYAIVIGNNQSDDQNVDDLKYADDDALAMTQLLREAGVSTQVFARLDAQSRTEWKSAGAVDGPPKWTPIRNALRMVAAEMQRARVRGERSTLYFVYSGHGDVANGEGYVVLEDHRLTRTMLHDEVLHASPADEIHVIIDACKSYFFANARGRRKYAGPFSMASNPADLPNVGLLLSTASDRESHEWERYAGGVFSYEVRSALRGAADANGDGAITYAELGAFVATANQSIPHERFRPVPTVHGPGGKVAGLQRVLLDWSPRNPHLRVDIDDGPWHVATREGRRILDFHAEPGFDFGLHLPRGKQLVVRKHDLSVEYPLPAEPSRLSAIQSRKTTSDIASRSQHRQYEKLFHQPFGPASVHTYLQRWEVLRRDQRRERGELRRTRVLRQSGLGLLFSSIGVLVAGASMTFSALARVTVTNADPEISHAQRLAAFYEVRKVERGSTVLYSVGAVGFATAVGLLLGAKRRAAKWLPRTVSAAARPQLQLPGPALVRGGGGLRTGVRW